MTTPIVTVLVDAYNHERFIEQALSSVVEQDFPAGETEILVVDDGSTDRTPEFVRRFEPRVRLIRKENGGQASAFNVGIPEARGEVVAFLDGDDWWKANKLSRVVETMGNDRSIGLVGHGIITVHADGHQETEVLLDVKHELTPEGGVRRVPLRRRKFEIRHFAWEVLVHRTLRIRNAMRLRRKFWQHQSPQP